MSTTHTSTTATGPRAATPVGAGPGGRRVRHEARDQAVAMAFSAVASCGIALLLLLLVQVAG